jgi:hypothetical protein
VEYPIHFGLGDCEGVDSLRVTWPDSRSERLEKLAVNQQITLEYNDANSTPDTMARAPDPLLADITDVLDLNYGHGERFCNKYARQQVRPHKE